MIIDDKLLALHQRIFDRIEYRWELTTAQVAEVALLLMWGVYAVKHVVSNDHLGWIVYVVAMSFLTVYFCKKTDATIRADRKTNALISLELRKTKPYVFLRVFILCFTLLFIVLFTGDVLTGKVDVILNGIGAVLNLFAVYIFNCIDDVDGDRRRAMDYEEAEKSMAKEHARW